MKTLLLLLLSSTLLYGCIKSNCDNGIQDGDEKGIDCEGICANECPPAPPKCNNNVQDEDETGIDCGGNCKTCFPNITPPTNQQFLDLQGEWYKDLYYKVFTDSSNNIYDADTSFRSVVKTTCKVEFTDYVKGYNESNDIVYYRSKGSVNSCSYENMDYTYSLDTLDGFYIDLLTTDSLRLIDPITNEKHIFLKNPTTIKEEIEIKWELELSQPYPYSDNLTLHVGHSPSGLFENIPIVPGQTYYSGTINYTIFNYTNPYPGDYFLLSIDKNVGYSSPTDEIVQLDARLSKYGTTLSKVVNAKFCAPQDNNSSYSCLGATAISSNSNIRLCRINWVTW